MSATKVRQIAASYIQMSRHLCNIHIENKKFKHKLRFYHICKVREGLDRISLKKHMDQSSAVK